MEKKERKRWLKDLAQKYVDESDSPFKVTFNISDAILIALYLKETDKKLKENISKKLIFGITEKL